jgi:hypothetical protein
LALSESRDYDEEIAVSIPGETLCGLLEIQLQVLFEGTERSSRSPFVPKYPGSILWNDVSQVELEGIASRFPIADVDFTESLALPSDAAWYLDIDDSDPEASLTQAICLYVNTRKPSLLAALTARSDPGQTIPAVDFLRFDLARSLVISGLRSPEILSMADGLPADSLAATLSRLIAQTFPGKSVASLSALLTQSPTRFESELQSRLRLFSE